MRNIILIIFASNLVLLFSCQKINEENKNRKYLWDNLKKYASEEFIITSEFECSMCVGEFIARVQKKYQEGSKRIIGLIYLYNKTPHREIVDLQKKTSNIVNWYYVNDLELMKALSSITKKKNGPYHVIFHNEGVEVSLLKNKK